MESKKLNRQHQRLIQKMIKRIETMPETYEQCTVSATFKQKPWLFEGRPMPVCGTVACLAGEAIICSEQSVAKGLLKLRRVSDVVGCAASLMGIKDVNTWIFGESADEWPEPYRKQWEDAKTYKGKARAAVNLLKAILRTDGAVLE